MTENKRFTVTQDFEEHHRQIRDNGHIIMGCFVEPQAEVIVNLLNELDSENKKLKEGVEEFNEICKYYEMRIKELSEQADAVRTELQLCEEENTELQKENEQLKSEINMLKTTIGRNEAYIQRMKYGGEWK